MKVKILSLMVIFVISGSFLFLLFDGERVYGEYRRNNRTGGSPPMIETDAVYEATLQMDTLVLKRQFRSDMHVGGLQDRAICAIQQAAAEQDILLPEGFTDFIAIKRLTPDQ